MGAWGMGIFDNDTACDWAYSLEESNDLSVVEDAIETVLSVDSDYLEAPDAEEALAACEVIARLRGNFGDRNSYTETVDNWVSGNSLKVPRELIEKAKAAIARIISDSSELAELWTESGDYEEWKHNIDNLLSRIGT
jgi:hypothetical protein